MTTENLVLRAEIAPNSFDDKANTVNVIWSTGAAVQRAGYVERLSLDPEHVNLDRLRGASVLDSHQQNGLRNVIGTVAEASTDGAAGHATIRLSRRADVADLVSDIRDGVIRYLSIGYAVSKWRDLTENGSRVREAINWQPREISFVAVPADPGAIVRSQSMETTTENRAETNGQIRTLTRAAGLPATYADGLIDRNATVEQTRCALFDEITRRNVHIPALQVGPSGDDPSVIRTRAADALAHRLGAPGELPEASREFRGQGLHQTLRMMLAARGEAGAFTMSVTDLITRSLTTSDLPVLLTETTNRLLMPAYTAAQSPVRQRLARQSTAADFRDLHRVRISEAPTLEKVEEHGEITSGGFTENDESYKVATYGRIVSVTFQALTNDDLGAFGRTGAAIGEAAAQTENNLLIALLTSNAGAGPVMSDGFNLFDAANHHNASASGAAIDATTISAGVLAMRNQKGLDGATPLSISPSYLLVPAAKEFVARQQVATIYPPTAEDSNPLQGTLEPLVEARLSGNRWYLFADPANVPVLEYAYLNGREGPQIDSRQGWEVLGVETRVVLHFGAGVVDYRGSYSNAGA